MGSLKSNMFGLIKDDCIATVMTGVDKNRDQFLKIGTLIEVISEYQEDGCIFYIRDFKQWLNIYKTTHYKCKKDDYITINRDMYLYLLCMKSDKGRIDFVKQVNNRKFDLNILKSGGSIRIRSPLDANVKYYEFEVSYKGFIDSISGYSIGLRLKNEDLLPSHLISLSKEYKFGGIGIVVPLDWILVNLYRETDYQQEPSKSINNTGQLEFIKDLSVDEICAKLNISNPWISKLPLKEIIQIDAMQQPNHQSSIIPRIENNINPMNHQTVDNNANRSAKNNEKTKCDLSDVEIKDCVSYNKILENRITEYNATKRIDKESNKGNRNQIENIPEPCVENTPNEKINTNTNEIVKTKIVEHTTFCGKCKKKLIPISKCITLESCKHTICYDCITPINKFQTSEIQYPQCPICPKQLNGAEVVKITGSDMLKLILDYRANKPHDGNIFELCFCQPTVKNCGIVLNCKHKFCRTFLIGTLKEQLQRISRSVCPLCYDEIDDCQKKRLVVQMKLGVVKKCRMCHNRADMLLVICQHPFCRKCVNELITSQVLDPSKVTINCIICQARIADSDITQYGNEKLLAQFKSKTLIAPLSSKPADYSTLHNCRCVSCNQWILIKHGIILAGCQHYFCLNCFKEFIGRQLNSKIPICPICQNLNEVKVQANVKTICKSNGDSQILVDCLMCEGKFEKRMIHKCVKCSNSVCLKCAAKSSNLNQISNNQSNNCPFCQIISPGSTEIVNVENISPNMNTTATARADAR